MILCLFSISGNESLSTQLLTEENGELCLIGSHAVLDPLSSLLHLLSPLGDGLNRTSQE